jgi:hypothetical protein
MDSNQQVEKLLLQLLEKAKKNKKGLIMLKNTAVRCQEFEIAAIIRGLERKHFPESEADRKAKQRARDLGTLFRMVDLNISDKNCLLIYETLELFKKKKGKFGIDDASKLKHKMDELFLVEWNA